MLYSSIEIPETLFSQISEYCSANDLDIRSFTEKLIRRALATELYGAVPMLGKKEESNLGKIEQWYDEGEETATTERKDNVKSTKIRLNGKD